MLADLYRKQGRPDDEYAILSPLAQENADDIELQRRLLQCRQVHQDLERAQQIVERIESLEGSRGWRWRYEQALLYFRQDDFDRYFTDIESLLQENLRSHPDHLQSRQLLAQSYAQAGYLQMAVSAYEEALSRFPSDMRIVGPAIETMVQAGRHDRVERIIYRLDPQMLQDPRIQTQRLQSYLEQDRISDASAILEQLALADPDNVNVAVNMAILAARGGDIEQASQILAEQLERHPESMNVISIYARVQLESGDSQAALELADQAVDNIATAQAYMLRAQIHSELDMTDRALEDYQRAIDASDTPVTALLGRSNLYSQSGEVEKAIQDIEEAASLDPDNLTVQKLLIDRYLASGQPQRIQQASEFLEDARQSYPDDSELKMIEARFALAQEGRAALESAGSLLEEITDDNPENVQAWALLAEIALEQEQIARAIDVTMSGLSHNRNNRQLLNLKARAEARRSPDMAIPTMRSLYEQDTADIDTGLQLAQLYVDSDQGQRAVELIENLMDYADNPEDDLRCKTALAMALDVAGSQDRAIAKLQTLMEDYPDAPDPLRAMVTILQRRQDWAQIAEKTISWQENNPQDTQLSAQIAAGLAGAGDPQAGQQAETILRSAIETNPDSPQAKLILAGMLLGAGEYEEPAQLYRRVIEIDDQQVIAMNNLAWILATNYQQFDEALELADRGLELQPAYADLLDTRGVIHKELGNYDRAVRDFNRALEIYGEATPSASTSAFNLAKVQMEMGRTQAARANLQKALSINENVGGLSSDEVSRIRNMLED